MKLKKSALFILLSLIIGVQSVLAATGIAVFDGPFRMLIDLFHNTNVVFGLTVIFFFSLLYGIYAAALKFVPVFKSEESLSHQGKVVGLALAGLSTLSIFYFTKGSPQKILQTVLDPFGIFAGLILAILFAGITYFGIRGNDPQSKSLAWAAVAAGFGMVIAGMITTQDSIMSWGFLIMLIAMIFALFASRFGGGHPDASGSHGSSTSPFGGDSSRDGSNTPHGGDGNAAKGPGNSGGLDYGNLGHVVVQVTDEDNNGIPDASVTIQAGHFGRRIFKGLTNNNGICPKNEQPAPLPSGKVIVVVDKNLRTYLTLAVILPGPLAPLIKHGRYHVEVPCIIEGGTTRENPQIIPIQLRRKSEKQEHFEPYIERVTANPDGSYRLEGIIR